MKILALFFICFNIFPSCEISTHAASENLSYAKVKADCLLYKTSDTDLVLSSNVYFTIPSGYFVTIVTDITSEVVKVKYGAFTGFVKSSKITKVAGTPTNPTLIGVTFSIKESSSTQIRSSPDTDDQTNIKHIIPSGTIGITYIAEIVGEIPPSGSSNIWYFAEYSPESDPVSVYYGYIYSEKCENLTPIPENHEFENELSNIENISEKTDDYIYLTGGIKALLLTIISLPMIIIFIILLISTKRNKNGKSILSEKSIFHKKPQNVEKNNENVPDFPTYDFDDDDLL